MSEPGVLRVEVPGSPVYVEMLQAKDNRRILVDMVSAQYGEPLGLRFESVPGETPAAMRTAVPRAAGPASAIQKVVDLFDGDVLGPA